MKVCHISFSFLIGGIENLLIDILNEQSKKANVSLIIVNKKYNKELLDRISNKVNIVLINRPQGNKWNFIYIIKLWLFLLRSNPKVIHCHTHNLIKILLPYKRKCIYTAHDVGIPVMYLRKYKKLFSISQAVKNDLKQRGAINSILIYNGIDCTKLFKRADYNFSGDTVLKIVQVSRLHHEKKGQDILIQAIDILVHKQAIKNIQIYIIGDGPSQNYLQELIEKYELTEHITLVGPKDRSWIYESLCHFHVLIQPSLFEGFGLTLIEALYAGLPVIASDIDGPAEILKGIPSALLFEKGNVNELVLKIKEVLAYYNNNQVKSKSDSSLTIIENKFSVASTAKSYLENYDLEN